MYYLITWMVRRANGKRHQVKKADEASPLQAASSVIAIAPPHTTLLARQWENQQNKSEQNVK